METITYQLETDTHETAFYCELSEFTGSFLTERPESALSDIKKFTDFHHNSSSRTFDEYYLEYLTLGTLLRKYTSNAMSSGVISMAILKLLYKNRNRISLIKPVIDKIRGILSTLLLSNSLISLKIDSAFRLKHFLRWMDATGEFSEETERLNYWYLFVKQLSSGEQAGFLKRSVNEAAQFEIKAKSRLGRYTENVDNFRKSKLAEHRYKENFLFCGRHEVEYHLNMFGAEILNRSLKRGFDATSKKVILFPTCMSNPADGKCKARNRGSKLICAACSPECNVNVKRWEYSSHNTEVVLIPHSSEFTRFLKHWKNQETTGLVGVACVLNLLKGGYEMQKLNIPSQCVFLDYCGCKKHWHKDGLPTKINEEQLRRVVG
jgi:hypothetical protein